MQFVTQLNDVFLLVSLNYKVIALCSECLLMNRTLSVSVIILLLPMMVTVMTSSDCTEFFFSHLPKCENYKLTHCCLMYNFTYAGGWIERACLYGRRRAVHISNPCVVQ